MYPDIYIFIKKRRKEHRVSRDRHVSFCHENLSIRRQETARERKKEFIAEGYVYASVSLPQRRLSNVEGKGWHVSRRERRDGSARVSDFRFPMVEIKEARSGKAGSSADRKVQELVSFFAEERKGNCERIEGARGKCN